MFNPDLFLDQTTTEANDTKFTPVPVAEYVAIIDEVKARQFADKNDSTKTYTSLDVKWLIDDENVKALLGRDKVTVQQSVFLDITESGGLALGKGQNIALGKLREAVGLNNPGQAFAPSMLNGRMAKIAVTHRDGKEPGDKIASVSAVTKLG